MYVHKRISKWLWILAATAGSTAWIVIDTAGDRDRLYSFAGLFAFILFGWIFSKHPKKIQWKQVLSGLALQFVFGLVVLRWEVGRNLFTCLGDRITRFLEYTLVGSNYVFGYLATNKKNEQFGSLNAFGFRVLSCIFFPSVVINLLYYYGVMQWVVRKLGSILQITLGTTAAESISSAANIFLGQQEAPLTIKPLLPLLTKSELHAVMAGGFATVAGTAFAAYINFGVSASHLLSASVMSAPASLSFAKLFYPESEKSKTRAEDIQIPKGKEVNALAAVVQGATSGVMFFLNITASLIAFLSFVAFLNGVISWFGGLVGVPYLTFELITGQMFIPLAWLMGVPSAECGLVAELVALKTIVNEFAAYKKMSTYMAQGLLSERSKVIATYALCGFSNPGSIGVQLATMGSMAPCRRADLAKVAFRAFVTGSIACFMTACMAGILVPSSITQLP